MARCFWCSSAGIDDDGSPSGNRDRQHSLFDDHGDFLDFVHEERHGLDLVCVPSFWQWRRQIARASGVEGNTIGVQLTEQAMVSHNFHAVNYYSVFLGVPINLNSRSIS